MPALILDKRRLRQALTIVLVAGALASMFPPQNSFWIWYARHAVYVALAYLGLGMLFLVLDKTRLMFVCLGCSGAISLFHSEEAKQLTPSPFPIEHTVPHHNLVLPKDTVLSAPDTSIFHQ